MLRHVLLCSVLSCPVVYDRFNLSFILELK